MLENKLIEIDKLKKELDAYRPLTTEQVKSLKTYFDIELTYNSNAIEGSTMTLAETKIILLDGITIGGKTTREHLEVINHKEAIDDIEEIAKKPIKEITLTELLNIHAIILRGIDTANAGKYRSVNVYVIQSDDKKHSFPEPYLLSEYMDKFFKWLKEMDNLHPVIFASEAHYRLVSIHPFVDGNGRTARLLMNLILIQHGYPPANIKMADRPKYIAAIEKAQRENLKDAFYDLIVDCVKDSLEIYLKTIKENILWK
jgi:Fic family protein